MNPANDDLLRIVNLSTHFFTREGVVRAVDDVSYSVAAGETLAVVGETGSGKSVTALSVLRLIASPPGRIVGGQILFRGENLLDKTERAMRAIRGNDISMIFQEPMSSLNPVLTIGRQIAEPLMVHQKCSRAQAHEKAIEMLELVQMPAASRRVMEHPHQLSGGMRQRVMIAIALACQPKLLIADEPTTALDVTIQAQILDLLVELKRKLGTAIVLITHDLGVVAEMAQRVVVMYAGRKVEEATVDAIFATPLHPYTRGLMDAIPRLSKRARHVKRLRLTEIPGMVPSLRGERIAGCPFAPRCSAATDSCHTESPELRAVKPGHLVACHHAHA